MSDEIDQMHRWIEQSGWCRGRQRTDCGRAKTAWYRRVNVKPLCKANCENPGVQVELMEHDYRDSYPDAVSYTVGLVAQCSDGVWVDFKCYSIDVDELKGCLESQVEKLAKAWVACHPIRESSMVVNEIKNTPGGKTLLDAVADCDSETLLRISRFSDELAYKVRDRLLIKAELDRSLFETDFGVCDYD
jgi:hypothetical protein